MIVEPMTNKFYITCSDCQHLYMLDMFYIHLKCRVYKQHYKGDRITIRKLVSVDLYNSQSCNLQQLLIAQHLLLYSLHASWTGSTKMHIHIQVHPSPTLPIAFVCVCTTQTTVEVVRVLHQREKEVGTFFGVT